MLLGLLEPPRSARVDQLMRNAARENRRPPRPIVRSIRIGRNAACPCGSGAKFKHCCGRQGNRGER